MDKYIEGLEEYFNNVESGDIIISVIKELTHRYPADESTREALILWTFQHKESIYLHLSSLLDPNWPLTPEERFTWILNIVANVDVINYDEETIEQDREQRNDLS